MREFQGITRFARTLIKFMRSSVFRLSMYPDISTVSQSNLLFPCERSTTLDERPYEDRQEGDRHGCRYGECSHQPDISLGRRFGVDLHSSILWRASRQSSFSSSF